MADSVPWVHGLLFVVCLALTGVASAGQMAFGHLNTALLRHLVQRGASRTQAIAELARDPAGLSSGVSILSILSVGSGTAVAADLAWRLVPNPLGTVLVLAGAFLLLFTASVFGRGIAAAHPERVAGRLLLPIQLVARGTALPLGIQRPVTGWLLRRLRGAGPAERFTLSEEDLRAAVQVVEETEELEEEEREMITSIFEMSDRDVREIMVPRLDVVAIEGSKSAAEALDLAVGTGHSRLLVFEGDLDHILGVVHLRDLAATLHEGLEERLPALSRPVHVVPETKKIDELLHEFQALHTQLALVVDEYGGTAGIVTIEDLLEEIVGEIRDEYDTEEDPIQQLSDQEAVMDGGVSIHDANEALPLHLDHTQYETIGGLVYDQLGKVPAPGDVVALPQCTIRVVATKGRRVQRVHVTLAGDAAGLRAES